MKKFAGRDPWQDYRNTSFMIEFDNDNEERLMRGEEPDGIFIPNFTPQQRAQIKSGLGSLLSKIRRKTKDVP